MKELREVPLNSGGSNRDPAHAALLEGAAIVERTGGGILRLTGKDPVGMLNAILTNSVPPDAVPGAYALLLNSKGRVQSDLRVLRSGTDVLVDTEPEGADAAREILGRYAPFSRVKIEDLSTGDETWSILGLYGPHAGELLDNLRLAEHESKQIRLNSANLLAAGVTTPVPGFDLLGPADALGAAREHLLRSGATSVEPDAYETARVAAGIPRFGVDITPENFPAEAGILDRAVSFNKGCYPGQETVARMHYRGHPNRTLHRLVLDSPIPSSDTPIIQNEKQAGRITSIAPLTVDGHNLALGYLSRNVQEDKPLSAGEAAVLLNS